MTDSAPAELTVVGQDVQDSAAATQINGKRPHPDSSPSAGRQQKLQKQQQQKQRPPKKKVKGRKPKKVTDGSAEEVLLADVQSLLATLKLQGSKAEGQEGKEELEEELEEEIEEEEDLPEKGAEIELDVIDLSSTGDGLAVWRRADEDGSNSNSNDQTRRRRRIYVVSFSVPGDVVRARVYRHLPAARSSDEVAYSVADFLEVVRPSASLRDPAGDGASRVRCRYFGRCSGCQYQMLDYGEQLRIKRRVVERAYRHFSRLPAAAVPAVLDTVASPLQYGYRTKLTPHFDGPPGFRHKNRAGHTLPAVPDIGFMQKGGGPRTTLDIEHCPIGTPAVAAGMARERARVARDYATYTRGATILLRENTTRRVRASEGEGAEAEDVDDNVDDDPLAVRVQTDAYTDVKTCITDNNATSTEYVDDYVFTNPAGSFFQNNNSILPALTAYVRANVLPPPKSTAAGASRPPIRFLVDAYSGSGLFTITLAATLPGGSIGIDIAEQSIAYARANAALNQLPPERCRFLAADAAQLFAGVSQVSTPADETVVVLDPPRKGCDAPFLRQLLAYGPARIVYVSCNVHTQARDVGMLVRGRVDGFGGEGLPKAGSQQPEAAPPPGATRYAIESLRGFDFFPQTAHVEGIAVLNRVDAVVGGETEAAESA